MPKKTPILNRIAPHYPTYLRTGDDGEGVHDSVGVPTLGLGTTEKVFMILSGYLP